MNFDSQELFTPKTGLTEAMSTFKKKYYIATGTIVIGGLLLTMAFVSIMATVLNISLIGYLMFGLVLYLILSVFVINNNLNPKDYQKQLIEKSLEGWQNSFDWETIDKKQYSVSGIALIENNGTGKIEILKSDSDLGKTIDSYLLTLDEDERSINRIIIFQQSKFKYCSMSSSVKGYKFSENKYQPLGQLELMVRYGFNL